MSAAVGSAWAVVTLVCFISIHPSISGSLSLLPPPLPPTVEKLSAAGLNGYSIARKGGARKPRGVSVAGRERELDGLLRCNYIQFRAQPTRSAACPSEQEICALLSVRSYQAPEVHRPIDSLGFALASAVGR